MSAADVDAVIVCYGVSEVLPRAVQALADDQSVRRIIVVDNGRTGDQLGELERASHGRVERVGNGENVGFGAGINRGAKHSSAAYLAIVNPDCIVANDALSALRDAMCKHPRAVAAGGLLLNQDGTEQEGGRRRQPTLLDAVARRLRAHRLPYIGGRFDFNEAGHPLPKVPTVVAGLSGAFMLVRRDAFGQIAGFDERFFLHFEDLDLCDRLRKNGGDLLFVPGARAIHAKGESSSALPLFVAYHKHRSYVLYKWKIDPSLAARLLIPVIAIGASASLAVSAVGAISRRFFGLRTS